MRPRIVLLSLLVLIVVSGSGPNVAGADDVASPSTDQPRATVGASDFTNYGTAWVPQIRNKFSQWKPLGWGTAVKVKTTAVGQDQWVHIPVPMPTLLDGSWVDISYVEFCAQSSSGASSKPVHWDLWSDYGQFYSENITWPADNNIHCIGHTFSQMTWQPNLGVTVLLHFTNSTHTITLYKAWVEVLPE